MTQEQAHMHFWNDIECRKSGIEPIMELNEWLEYYKKKEKNQKWRKSAEQRKRLSERKGIKMREKSSGKKRKPQMHFDRMSENKVRAIRLFAKQGKKREEICELLDLPYSEVDGVLREITWRHVK